MQQPLMFKLDQDPRNRGLRCDGDGLFLGRNALLDRDRVGNFQARPTGDLRKIFDGIYRGQTNWESRIRSVRLVANALNKGEMARAMMTAVLMRLPDPDSSIRIADVDSVLAKAGFNSDEARDERGRWTNGGSDGESEIAGNSSESRVAADPQKPSAVMDSNFRHASVRLTDAGEIEAPDDPVSQASARAVTATFDADDAPNLVLASAEGEDERDPRFGIGGNYPPLEELFPPRLLRSPAGPAVQFLDNLLDLSGPGDVVNLEVSKLQLRALLNEIHEVDPSYVYQSIEPLGGLAEMSWQARLNTINALRADLAAAIYRVRGDIRPLQEVTLQFMQRTTNAAYDEAVARYNTGRLNVRLSREEAIGSYVDGIVRLQLRTFFNGLGIPTDSASAVRVNNRAYNTSATGVSYRVPDARVGNLTFDVSLTAKAASDAQIKGFFDADFQPTGVVIVRPNQLGNISSYVIWRAVGR